MRATRVVVFFLYNIEVRSGSRGASSVGRHTRRAREHDRRSFRHFVPRRFFRSLAPSSTSEPPIPSRVSDPLGTTPYTTGASRRVSMSAVEMTPSPETAPLLGRRKAASAWPRRALAGVCAVAGCVALAAAAKHGALGGSASVASQKLGQSLGYTEDGKPQSANEFVHDECVKIYGDTTEGGVSP